MKVTYGKRCIELNMACNGKSILPLMIAIFCINPLFSSALTGITKGDECKVDGFIDKNMYVHASIIMSKGKHADAKMQAEIARSQNWVRNRFSGWEAVECINISINSITAFIPQSAAMDLYSITDIKIWNRKRHIYIRMHGGDAGESYSVTFSLAESRHTKNKYMVTERVWRQGEFYTDIFEKTSYRNLRWDMVEK